MTKRVSVAAAIGLLLAGGLEADNFAYDFTGTDQFGKIDLDSGAFTLIGNTGVLLCGLGVAHGALYGGEFEGNTFYRVDQANGGLTIVGNSAITYFLMGSTDRGLYAIDEGNVLYSVFSHRCCRGHR